MKNFIKYAKTFKTYVDFMKVTDPCFESIDQTEISYYYCPDNSGRRERRQIKGFSHKSFRRFFEELKK